MARAPHVYHALRVLGWFRTAKYGRHRPEPRTQKVRCVPATPLGKIALSPAVTPNNSFPQILPRILVTN